MRRSSSRSGSPTVTLCWRAASPPFGDDDNLISGVDESLGDVRDLLPGLEPLFHCASHGVEAHGLRLSAGNRTQPDDADARIKDLRYPELPRSNSAKARRTISTFSCDIARAVSRPGAAGGGRTGGRGAAQVLGMCRARARSLPGRNTAGSTSGRPCQEFRCSLPRGPGPSWTGSTRVHYQRCTGASCPARRRRRAQQDSNLRPLAPEASALSTELCALAAHHRPRIRGLEGARACSRSVNPCSRATFPLGPSATHMRLHPFQPQVARAPSRADPGHDQRAPAGLVAFDFERLEGDVAPRVTQPLGPLRDAVVPSKCNRPLGPPMESTISTLGSSSARMPLTSPLLLKTA